MTMLKYIFAGLLIGLFSWPSNAGHEMMALDRNEIMKSLERDYQERVVSRGFVSDGSMLEVVASPNGETFTIVITNPMGGSQLVIAGTLWSSFEPEVKKGGS